jgi:hypothetical protein
VPLASLKAENISSERNMVSWLIRLRPALVLLPLLAFNAVAHAEEQFTLSPGIGLNALAALVDQQLDSVRNGLRILAATENVTSGDWDRMKTPLVQFAKDQPFSAAVWFARPDGSYFTVEAGLTNQSLKDRTYFPALMAGQEVAGDLVVSKSTGKRSVIIAVPVVQNAHVIGAVGASIALEKVATFIETVLDFPSQVMFYALDPRGQIALHRESGLLFEFATDLGSPTLTSAVKEILAKPEGAVHYEFQGAEREAIFKKSGAIGWVYALRW